MLLTWRTSLANSSWRLRSKLGRTIMWYKGSKRGRFQIELFLLCRKQWFFCNYVWRNYPYCQASSIKMYQMMVLAKWLKRRKTLNPKLNWFDELFWHWGLEYLERLPMWIDFHLIVPKFWILHFTSEKTSQKIKWCNVQ